MNTQMLLENFALIANAPGGLEKLRNMTVFLGIKGRLTANNPNEEPVTLPLTGINDAGYPLNWRSGTLEEALVFEYGKNLPAKVRSETGEFPVFGSNGIVGTHDSYLTEKPAIIVGRKGSAGALNISVLPSWTTDVAYYICPPAELDLRFVFYLLTSFDLPNLGKGIKPGLSRKDAYKLPVAIPPVEEQKRIVAKVDELMALCDKLEAQQQERERHFPVLSRACHTRFVESPSLDNLKAIFDEAGSVSTDELRKTVLDLACLGKLVPQNNFNSTGKDLVEKIQAKRVELQNLGKISSRKPCRPWNHDEVPFNIPTSWTWTMLGEATDIGTGSTPSTDNSQFWLNGTIPWIASGSTSYSRILAGDELVTEEAVIAHRLRIYSPGTLLVALYGQGKTRGQVSTLEINATINQALAAICPIEGYEEMQDFLKILLLRNYDEIRSQSAGGAQPNLNVQKIKEMFIPLPPLAEQRRIVAKVNQLMALIDKLEEQQARKAKVAEAFAQAAVSVITGAEIKLTSSPF